jgi:predicted enzyme related to lactoylglutathione lyase
MARQYYSHAAQVLMVADMDRSLHFYENLLDFEVTFLWQSPPTYAVLKANESINIHLSKAEDQALENKPTLYIFVTEIDALYEELIANGVSIHSSIGNRDYQMRDFDIIDPDGYRITFGQGL